jgi:acyl dehydratase
VSEQRYFEDVEPGDEIEEPVDVGTAAVQRYLSMPGNRQGASVSRFNDAERAKADGLPGPIVPGVMQLGLMNRVLRNFAGIYGTVGNVDVSFRRSVIHGDNLKAHALVTDTDEAARTVKLDVFLENDRGERPLQGTADVVLPAKE